MAKLDSESLEQITEAVRQATAAQDPTPERVSKLEDKVERLDAALRELQISSGKLEERVSHLPKKGFIVVAVISALSVFAGIVTFGDDLKGARIEQNDQRLEK